MQNQKPVCRTGRSKIKNQILFLLIILLAFILRFYQLGFNPPSLDWDEASLGYNAYSILKTGKDEFGRFLPISIRSFEDYKPAMYAYLIIPAIVIFGLNEFSTRLPSAVFGILTVLVTYFLIKQLFFWINSKSNQNNRNSTETIALITTLLLTISPWHLQFSRVAFEANVGLFLVISGALFFFKGLIKNKWWLISTICFTLSFYTYHSPRLIVPLLLAGWVVYFRRQLWQAKQWFIIVVVIGIIGLMPFIKESLSTGSARLSSVTVLTPEGRLDEEIKRIEFDQNRFDLTGKLLHNRRVVYAKAVVKGYLDHFNLDFLFLTGDGPKRHHAPDMGMLYVWEAPFVLLGIIQLVKKRHFLTLWWFLVAPVASAITTGTPHAVRALYYLPLYQIFTAIGLLVGYQWLRAYQVSGIRLNIKYQVIELISVMLISINIFYYLNLYYVHSPVEAAKEWQYGFKNAITEIAKYETQVDKIIITYAYDQPHVFVLFYRQIDPDWYQSQYHGQPILRDQRQFGKYEFRKIDWEKDKQLTNVLLVGTPSEIPDTHKIIKKIYYPDKTVAFHIAKI